MHLIKKKLILIIILISPFILMVKAQVKSRYDREVEALEKLSKMKDDEEKVRDIIYSYKSYIQDYINRNLQNISSSEYQSISNQENLLWKSIMENRRNYSFESQFYSAAKTQLEYYKSTMIRATNNAIKRTEDLRSNIDQTKPAKKQSSLLNPYVTTIVGQFKGWDGENIYKTKEGAIWQQADNTQMNYILDSPKALLYVEDNIIFMKVEGTEFYVKVNRLK